MRLIDADALRFKNVAEVNGILTHILTADEIDNAPTAEPPRQYVIKAKTETDIEKLKAVFKGLATTPQFEVVPLTPEGYFTIEELRSWLYQIAINNTPSDFEKDVVEIIQRLDGFERFVKERRTSNE